ncbi:AttF component of AttEFGH ABC transport system [Candidatus Rhodobacter oscarellae]|uniref:AttF component of AttEFGH ABC transport system n=1 Tax=Candidatus Rhodobacter oscarellae TaxID=1675527 RepID=A0A0J9E165_9RHOB|nr:AttF component of AttEFGH ABC transport system [Candidatus Rhodobacter lobularis]
MQLLTMVIGLALATALWSGVQAINAEARASYDQAARALGETQFTQLIPEEGNTIPTETFVALRRAGVLVSPLLEGRLQLDDENYQLVGFDALTAPMGLVPNEAQQQVDIVSFFAPPYQIIANPEDAGRIRGLTDATVIAVDTVSPGVLLTDLYAAQAMLVRGDEVSRLLLLPNQPRNGTPPDLKQLKLVARSPSQGNDISRLTGSFHLNLTAFGLLSFAVGLFIVHGTIGLAFEQRRGLFRTLRALGMPLRMLLVLLMVELLFVSLVAGGAGMVLGYVIASVLLPDVAATLRGLYGAEIDGTLSIRPIWWAAGMAIAVLGTAVAAAGSIAKIIRMPILAPAQPRAWALLSERRMWLQGILVLALLAVALIASQLQGLVAGFALLGGLLLAAALALPIILSLLLFLAQHLARAPIPSWFWADTRQQLPGLSLALMALLLALATNIGVGTMVGSFRTTFLGWLDQRLASELYVNARSNQEAEVLQSYLAPRADAVLPIWNIEARVAGLPAEIYGIIDHATYRDNWPLLEAADSVWQRVASGDGALVNEQLALRENLHPGDSLELPGAWQTIVAGIYSDYGNPNGQVIVGLDALVKRFPDLQRQRFGIRIAPDKARALARTIRDEFGLPAERIIHQAELKSFSVQIFERTFTVTAALNVLTLAVAGFAILTSLLTLSAMRAAQVAPLWAMGLTRRRLALLELLRSSALALMTLVLSIPVGILLAWVLLTVINVEAFGWRLPMRLYPTDWAWLALWSLIAAMLSAAWPAYLLSRKPPAELLKVFANER